MPPCIHLSSVLTRASLRKCVHLKKLFITTPAQRAWLEKLSQHEQNFSSYSRKCDEQATFPKENVQTLVEIGYTKLTLPQTYGGEGINVTEMILLQETIASYDGSTGLSIGWHQGVVGELYEQQLWEDDKLEAFAKEVVRGALMNRAVSEAQTGSPSRGGRPGTHAQKQGQKWVVSGRKNFTTMSPVLTHFLVSAWIPEKKG